SNEGPPSFSCKMDGVQSTFHAAIRAARSAPDRVACPQPSFRGSIIQRIGIQPERFGSQSQSFSRMRNGLLRRQMILVLWIVVGNDADAKCAPHTRVYIQHGKTTSREQRRHHLARKEAERLGAEIAGNSRNREPADEMVRTQLSLKPDDILNAAFGVAQDNPVFSQAFNCEPAWRAFDDRMGPSEIHPLKGFDKRIASCANGLSVTAGDKDVAQNGDMAFGFSHQEWMVVVLAQPDRAESGSLGLLAFSSIWLGEHHNHPLL